MKFRLFCVVLAVGTLLSGQKGSAAQDQFAFQIFDRYLESLIPQIGMPGLSAIILQEGKIAWEKHYGFADVENKVRTSGNTLYAVGGVTQAMTGVLVGVCADRYFFQVDRDIRQFAPAFPFAETSVRQVLAHATDGHFRYDAGRFASLTPVVESRDCFDKPFRQAIATEVLDRLALRSSVPGLDLNRADGVAARALFPPDEVERYQRLLANVAVPYRIDVRGRSTPSQYPSHGLDAASGMVATAADLAKFEGELDKRNGVPLSFSTLDRMWSNQSFRVKDQEIVMPTGLGWFVTTESGQRLVWTFGHIPDASSALIVKMLEPTVPTLSTVPPKRLTLILLANSPGLAQGYDLENANVTSSPFVKVFLRLFI
jgi:CubicO group peptidase (beta-lactamase class C family)